MSIIQGTSKTSAAAAYEISQSVRFNDNDSASLTRTPSSAGDRRTFTFSCWVKRANLTGANQPIFSAGGDDWLMFLSAETLGFNTSGSNYRIVTSQLFRDPGAWFHLVLRVDTTNATAGDRLRLYINGSEVTDFGTDTNPTLNFDTAFNNTGEHRIGKLVGASQFFDGYLAEINHVDGSSLGPSSFGETNDDGVWIPKAYDGSYGSNGFYITGETASDLGEDFSGNGNDFTSSGLATTDQMLDTPTNNFCTLNPVEPTWGGAVTLSDGNLALAGTAATVWNNAIATFKTLPSTGKWIWASEPNTSGAGRGDPWIVNETGLASRNNYVYIDANGWETTFDSASVKASINNGVSITTSHSYGAGDFNVVCFDADSKKLWFGLYDVSASQLKFQDSSGGLTGDPAAGTNQTYTLTGNEFSIGFATYTGRSGVVDFGQSNLLSQFTAPTDFKTLCTANLATPSIKDGSKYFNPVLFTGNSGTAFSVTGVGFQPDFVWGKPQSYADNHRLMDVVRGSTEQILSNSTSAEFTQAQGITSFDSDGFTVGTHNGLNTGTNTYVAWNWLADNTTGSSNTDGATTSTVSANTTSGFSIVKWTGTGANTTLGHGLGAAPQMILIKNLADADSWVVYHEDVGATKGLTLDTTAAATTASTFFNNTAPTSSVFSVGSGGRSNGSSDGMIAYCFAEVAGYSSFGSYTGNGSTDGPFVYTGFTPRFVLFKRTNTTESWPILDTARGSGNFGSDAGSGGDNPTAGNDLNAVLVASTNAAEEDNPAGSRRASFNSNGFKVRTTNTAMNGSGSTYIYMAFAEHPFGGDGVAPATAR